MTDKDTLNICSNHKVPFMYHGEECPWCKVLEDYGAKLNNEYRRGFEDGVRAADNDHAKRQQELAIQLAMEVKRGTGRVSDPGLRSVQDGVQGGGAEEGGGVAEGDQGVEAEVGGTGGKE